MSEDSRVEIYRRMALIRAFERACLKLSADGEISGSIHLCLGQEAIPVGIGSELVDDDRVVATYRGHGWAIEAGIPLRELMAEICHRAGGVNGGRGGSAYFSSVRHGFYGENSIVGGGIPIATGLAMSADRQGDGLCIVSIGDGAMNQGATHEGLVFAAANNLPLVVVCENNEWSEMTPTASMTRGSFTDRVGGYGIHSVAVDGCDPLAVESAMRDARKHITIERGPVFLECRTTRLSGHYNRDIEHYRSKEDKEDAERREPIARLRRELVDDGDATAADLDAIEAEATETVDRVVESVLAMPPAEPSDVRSHVQADASDPDPVDVPDTEPTEMTYQRAVNSALRAELIANENTVVYGEDVGKAGGIFGVTRQLQREFGEDRVFDTPISESAILGSAVGAAMTGMRPIVEIMWADFLLVALDQLINQAANTRYVSRGELTVPMVVRTQQGATPGSCAQHSQSLEALLTHIPGLKVGLPATPHDAYAMLRAAAADPDPCILIEARALYQNNGPVWEENLDAGVFGSRLVRDGRDVALITWGTMVTKAEEAADQLAQDGIEASVLDLRWLSPLDDQAITRAVESSKGRVVIVHEANLTGGFGAEVAARIQERHFTELQSGVARVATLDVPIPAAPDLQGAVVPDVSRIVAACRDQLTTVSAGTSGNPS